MAFQEFIQTNSYDAGEYVWQGDVLCQFMVDHQAGPWNWAHVKKVSKKELINMLGDSRSSIEELYEAIQKIDSDETKRYGVSGIGQQTAALTRLYDAVGEGKKSVGRGGGGMRALRGLLTGLSARNLEACADGAFL